MQVLLLRLSPYRFSISLGIASGSTPTRGLATAIFGGLSSGFFASSNYNIIGPAGALSGMLMAYSVKWKTDEVLPWMCLISAAFVAAILLLRLQRFVALVPAPVFEGFTFAVAIIIGLGQLNFALGVTPAQKHESFIWNVYESLSALATPGQLKMPSLVVFIVTTPLLLFLMRKYAKVPWTVIIPFLSIFLGWLGGVPHADEVSSDSSLLPLDLLTLKSKYGDLPFHLYQPLKPLHSIVPNGNVFLLLLDSAGIAFVAVLETLISARIAASRTGLGFDEAAEVRGLAIAHGVCGITGAIPPTGVFVRTALNTSLGATHRFAQVLQATIVAIISLVALPVFLFLPQATIAAILSVAAARMAPVEYLAQLYREGGTSFWLCIGTAAACVVLDPVYGLLLGTILHFLPGILRRLTGRGGNGDIARSVEGEDNAKP